MREAASASMLDIADQIDDLLADILDEKGRRTPG